MLRVQLSGHIKNFFIVSNYIDIFDLFLTNSFSALYVSFTFHRVGLPPEMSGRGQPHGWLRFSAAVRKSGRMAGKCNQLHESCHASRGQGANHPVSRCPGIRQQGDVYDECTVHEPGADIDLERYWIVL